MPHSPTQKKREGTFIIPPPLSIQFSFSPEEKYYDSIVSLYKRRRGGVPRDFMYANFSFPGKNVSFSLVKKGGRRIFFPFILAHTWERRERIGGNIWESVGNHARLTNWQNF